MSAVLQHPQKSTNQHTAIAAIIAIIQHSKHTATQMMAVVFKTFSEETTLIKQSPDC